MTRTINAGHFGWSYFGATYHDVPADHLGDAGPVIAVGWKGFSSCGLRADYVQKVRLGLRERLRKRGRNVTERAQNADFRRKPPIFADSALLMEIQAFGGRRKLQKTADLHRKPKIFAENRRKAHTGLRHLGSVTFSSALVRAAGVQNGFGVDFPQGKAKGQQLKGKIVS